MNWSFSMLLLASVQTFLFLDRRCVGKFFFQFVHLNFTTGTFSNDPQRKPAFLGRCFLIVRLRDRACHQGRLHDEFLLRGGCECQLVGLKRVKSEVVGK